MLFDALKAPNADGYLCVCLNFDKGDPKMNNSNLTFEDLERKYYLEGNIFLANLYAQLDDFERSNEDLEDALWEVKNNGKDDY